MLSCQENLIEEVTCEVGYLSNGGECYLDVSQTCELYEMFDASKNACIDSRTYLDKLENNPMDINFSSDYDFEEYSGILLDYSDDYRNLWDRSNFKDSDVVHFPDEAFEEGIIGYLSLSEEEELTYGLIKEVTILSLSDKGITSIEGIELFENLEGLVLSSNLTLTSIRGVETLENLETLNIAKTSVKNVEYDMSSLLQMDIRNILLEVLSFSDFVEVMSGYRNIEGIDIRGIDNIKIDKPYQASKLFNGGYSANYDDILYVDIDQIDLNKVRIYDIYEYNEYSNDTSHPRIANIEIDFGGIYINEEDYGDARLFYNLGKTLVENKNSIGINDSMDEATKVFYIYNFVFDLYTKEETGEKYKFSDASTMFKLLLNAFDIRNYEDYVNGIYGNIDTKEIVFRHSRAETFIVLEDSLAYLTDIELNIERYLEDSSSNIYQDFLFGYLSLKNQYQDLIDNATIPEEFEYLSWNIPTALNKYSYNLDILIEGLDSNIVTCDESYQDAVKLYLHTDGELPITYYYDLSNDLTLDVSSKKNNFDNWYLDEEKTQIWDESTVLTNGTHLYGSLIPKEYTISFTNDSESSIDDLTVNFSEYVELPILQRDGYVFMGWSQYGSFIKTKMYQFNQDKDITLKAEWLAFDEVFNYEIVNEDEIKLTAYLRNDTYVYIPNMLNGLEITVIGQSLFSSDGLTYKDLTYISIGENISTIEDYAFRLTTNLKHIELPISLEYIGKQVFAGSNALILIDESLDTSTYASDWADAAKVTKSTDGLQIEDNYLYVVNEFDEVTLLELLNTNELVDLNIPNTINQLPVKAIYNYFAYNDHHIRSLVISANVESVGKAAFSNNSNLEEVLFEDNSSIDLISSYAFFGSSISEIVLPLSLNYIGKEVFGGSTPVVYFEGYLVDFRYVAEKWYDYDSYNYNEDISKYVDGYESTYVQDGIVYALRSDFTAYVIGAEDSHKTSISVPNEVNGYEVIKIFNEAFKDDMILRKIEIPNTVTSISKYAFDNAASLTEVIFEENSKLERIYPFAFANTTNLMSFVNLPAIDILETNTFYKSGLLYINIPEGVLEIKYDAFNECNSLKAVYLPETLTSLSSEAFEDNSKIFFAINSSEISTILIDASIPEDRITFSITRLDITHEFIYGINKSDELTLMYLYTSRYFGDEYQDLEIPTHIGELKVKALGNYFLEGYEIEGLYIFEVIEEIYEYAFYGSNIYDISIRYYVPDYYDEFWNYDGHELIDFYESVY
jgi:hypothetical protein